MNSLSIKTRDFVFFVIIYCVSIFNNLFIFYKNLITTQVLFTIVEDIVLQNNRHVFV